ncbi:hypothetical protein OESDEN_03747 [Oesophagostomum dentatum]|uniref:SXP/RAL-2 family protein Ani s 5-like cation-binding domain-containing protein n=1 Tax=Oesophagostomum dentatum TaxID=61180 RepID=A0A0B1TKE4_OESDE|nr:hypothetical protein OESDEN_03747 [Oesophagostomum dentatum]
MRMLFILICHGVLIALTISCINYAKQQEKTEQRREKLESTIKKLAQRVTEAAHDPQQKVTLEAMKQYVTKTEQRREKLESTIKKLAQRVTEAAHDPQQKITLEAMKQYVTQAYGILRNIDNGYAADGTSSVTDEFIS